MKKETEIRHGRHVVFNLHVHLVFVTKYRRGVFTKAILEDLEQITVRWIKHIDNLHTVNYNTLAFNSKELDK